MCLLGQVSAQRRLCRAQTRGHCSRDTRQQLSVNFHKECHGALPGIWRGSLLGCLHCRGPRGCRSNGAMVAMVAMMGNGDNGLSRTLE